MIAGQQRDLGGRQQLEDGDPTQAGHTLGDAAKRVSDDAAGHPSQSRSAGARATEAYDQQPAMRDSRVGLQAGVNARKWARLLRRAHESALNGGHVPTIVREVIANSWERCSESGVDPAEPGAPVHDPETGGKLGAIDVTGTYDTAHPHNLVVVQLAARLAEQQLRGEMLERDARILGLVAEHAAHHGGRPPAG
jgi:hypothetical protein